MRVVLSGITENDSVRGVERYVLELARYLVSVPTVQSVVLLAGEWQGYYADLIKVGVKVDFVKDLKRSRFSRHFFHFWTIRKYLQDSDVLHVCNTLPIFNPSRQPIVVTIHDLAEYFVPEKYGFLQRYYRRFVARLAASQAVKIITVSDFSKKVICDHLGVPESKVSAIYNGCEHLLSTGSDGAGAVVSGRYVLYWGVVERTKGLRELVSSMSLVRTRVPDAKLVIVGKKGNAWQDIESAVCQEGWVEYLGYVDDRELVSLIKGAAVVAFPSVYEGFGFPAVEAFIYNDNVVASSTTALGEVTSSFARQVDPSDVFSISDGIVDLIENPKFFVESERLRILSQFSWTKGAVACAKVYEEAAYAAR